MHIADADVSVLTPTGTILRYDASTMAFSTARGRDEDALRLELCFFQFGEGSFLSTSRTRTAPAPPDPSRAASIINSTQASPGQAQPPKQVSQQSTPAFQRAGRARKSGKGADSGVT